MSAVGRRVLLAATAVAVAAVLLLLVSFHAPPSLVAPPPAAPPARYLLELEVEGPGALLVNGSAQSLVSSARPFTALVEAAPGRCSRLVELLVNGTPVNASRVELAIGGNTTVKAVFEKPVYTVAIEGDVEGAAARVNGTEHSLPATLAVKACEVLSVTPVAPPRYYSPNGSLLVNVTGDLKLRLHFKRWLVTLTLRNLTYPARVKGEVYNGSVELELPAGKVEVETLKAKCLLFNDTHLVCPAGWLAKLLDWSLNGSTVLELPGSFTLELQGDAVLEQRVSYLKLKNPVARLQVQTPSGPFEARAIPGSRWVGEYIAQMYSGTVEAVDGWLKLEGHCVTAFLELPKGWGKIRVYAKRVSPLGSARTHIWVVLRNDEVYHDFGVALPPTCFSRGRGYSQLESYTVLTIDSGVMSLAGKRIVYLYSPVLEEAKKFFTVEQAWCNTEPECCTVEWSESMGTKTFEGVEAGWLAIDTEGTLLIKVEVVEWRG
ncbi:MAG: hypothetical protein QXJ21_05490 [Thermofilum sp.]